MDIIILLEEGKRVDVTFPDLKTRFPGLTPDELKDVVATWMAAANACLEFEAKVGARSFGEFTDDEIRQYSVAFNQHSTRLTLDEIKQARHNFGHWYNQAYARLLKAGLIPSPTASAVRPVPSPPQSQA